MTVTVSEATFKAEVLDVSVPVLVDFGAERCAPCKAMEPVLEELSIELDGKVKIAKVDVDENPGLSAQFSIRSIPAMILFKDGNPVDMKVGGGARKAGLKRWLEGHAA